MTLEAFIAKLSKNQSQASSGVSFEETMAVIDAYYEFTPSAFKNGEAYSDAGENNGSCKIFAFGLLHQLTEQQTLVCFGDYYSKDVLLNPDNNDHKNIRSFMVSGWQGIAFEGQALTRK